MLLSAWSRLGFSPVILLISAPTSAMIVIILFFLPSSNFPLIASVIVVHSRFSIFVFFLFPSLPRSFYVLHDFL